MSVTDYDVYIVQVGKVYLVAVAYEDTKMCRFSENYSDALRIQDERKAAILARRMGGIAVKFNPITGRIC